LLGLAAAELALCRAFNWLERMVVRGGVTLGPSNRFRARFSRSRFWKLLLLRSFGLLFESAEPFAAFPVMMVPVVLV